MTVREAASVPKGCPATPGCALPASRDSSACTTGSRVCCSAISIRSWLGMHRILDDGGVDVIAIEDAPAMVIASAYRLAPDAVVLGADMRIGRAAALVRAAGLPGRR